jgi:hypothetical protein
MWIVNAGSTNLCIKQENVGVKMHTRFWWGNLKEPNHLEDLGVYGGIVLEEIWEGLDWIYVVLDRNNCRAIVN